MIACFRPAEIDLPPYEPEVVVNAQFTPGKNWEVYLTQSRALGDTTIRWISDAEVLLFENGVLHDSLVELSLGKYGGTQSPIAGKCYRIEVRIVDEVVSAEDCIPLTVMIDSTRYTIGRSFSINDNPYQEQSIYFRDPDSVDNFYEVLGSWEQSDDPSALAEGYQSYFFPLVNDHFFADPLFAGENHVFISRTEGSRTVDINGCYTPSSVDIWVILRTTSETYYRYRKSWTRQLFNRNIIFESVDGIYDLMFLSEPQNVYSNVEGGLGVFAGYAQDSMVLTYIK
ncbi:MAG: DUF4249 domain-containing protein [Bacteroidota bacterium]